MHASFFFMTSLFLCPSALPAEETVKECQCLHCSCTLESHCGCLSGKGCQCEKGKGCKCEKNEVELPTDV